MFFQIYYVRDTIIQFLFPHITEAYSGKRISVIASTHAAAGALPEDERRALLSYGLRPPPEQRVG